VRATGEGDYDIQFKADDKIFRYWDATSCVEFGVRMAQQALEVELRNESNFILHYDAVYKDINDRFEMRSISLTKMSVASVRRRDLEEQAKALCRGGFGRCIPGN
jgi:hypothetical protein